MATHLSHALGTMVGQLKNPWHHEIHKAIYARKPMEEWICQLCYHGLESKEHHTFHCTPFYGIRGWYYCLSKQGFGPLLKIMDIIMLTHYVRALFWGFISLSIHGSMPNHHPSRWCFLIKCSSQMLPKAFSHFLFSGCGIPDRMLWSLWPTK